MSMGSWVAVAIALVVVAMVGVFLVVGPDRIWALLGSPDLGPVAFETLQRRTSPNDALACPADICQARSDMAAPDYDVGAGGLRRAFAKMIASEPRVAAVASDDATLTDRYVQRSAVLRFPDTIVVRFFDRPGGKSTVALYSRSQLGRGDFGVNRARIEHWLAMLDTYAKAERE